MTDLIVWPLFIAQLVAFVLLLFPRRWHFLGIRMPYWIGIILFVVCILVVVSLFHDSSTPEHLYF